MTAAESHRGVSAHRAGGGNGKGERKKRKIREPRGREGEKEGEREGKKKEENGMHDLILLPKDYKYIQQTTAPNL